MSPTIPIPQCNIFTSCELLKFADLVVHHQSMTRRSKYKTRRQKAAAAELDLLLSLARGKKTFEQVVEDAKSFGFAGSEIQRLVTSNPARGVTQRLEQVAGISKNSLRRS